jgi:hypothetical protein
MTSLVHTRSKGERSHVSLMIQVLGLQGQALTGKCNSPISTRTYVVPKPWLVKLDGYYEGNLLESHPARSPAFLTLFKAYKDYRITEFYTEWYSVYPNNSLKSSHHRHVRKFVKRNNASNKTCTCPWSLKTPKFVSLNKTAHEKSPRN